jgi:hypothetical protein
MLKQLRHKRFIKTLLNDMSLSLRCYWYAQATGSSVPAGIENNNDNDRQRPDHFHAQE